MQIVRETHSVAASPFGPAKSKDIVTITGTRIELSERKQVSSVDTIGITLSEKKSRIVRVITLLIANEACSVVAS